MRPAEEVMECEECGELIYLHFDEEGRQVWCCHNIHCGLKYMSKRPGSSQAPPLGECAI